MSSPFYYSVQLNLGGKKTKWHAKFNKSHRAHQVYPSPIHKKRDQSMFIRELMSGNAKTFSLSRAQHSGKNQFLPK